MNIYTFHYTYKITNTNPTTNEKFYIGVHSSNSLSNSYLGSSEYLNVAIRSQGKEFFKKEILAVWESRNKAEAHEEFLHATLDVARNKTFYNRRNANQEFLTTRESINKAKLTRATTKWQEEKAQQKIDKIKATVNAPEYADKKKKQNKLHSETMNSIEWKNTVGKEKQRKIQATRALPSWQNTIGDATKRKIKETKSTLEWRQNVQQPLSVHLSKLRSSDEYKNGVGAIAVLKDKETKSSSEWIEANTFVCEHCHKSMVGRGNYSRWHGDNCKYQG